MTDDSGEYDDEEEAGGGLSPTNPDTIEDSNKEAGGVVGPTKLLQELSLPSQKLMMCHRVVREFPFLKRFSGV